MSTNYCVVIEKYAEKYYIKSFSKKYRKAWDVTMEALKRELQSFEVLLLKSIAKVIVENEEFRISKVEFKVAGTNKSRHGSGNRCIVAVDNKNNVAKILLLYHKSHLGGGNETTKWKQMVKENYSEYKNVFTL